MLGYSIIEDTTLVELDSLRETAEKIGFKSIGMLLGRLYTACSDYLRTVNPKTALAVTIAISHIQFALSSLDVPLQEAPGNNDQMRSMLEQL